MNTETFGNMPRDGRGRPVSKLLPIDALIFEHVREKPGVPLTEIVRSAEKYWTDGYTRTRVRTLKARGVLRCERGPAEILYVYPGEAFPA